MPSSANETGWVDGGQPVGHPAQTVGMVAEHDTTVGGPTVGWMKTFAKLLVTDDKNHAAPKGQRVTNIYGKQSVYQGSIVRLLSGEWKGEDAVVTHVSSSGQIEAQVQRNGRTVRTWENKVQVLKGTQNRNQTLPRKGMQVRINRGEYRGRIGIISDVHSNGKIWVKITGGNDPGFDPRADKGKEVTSWQQDVTLIGR